MLSLYPSVLGREQMDISTPKPQWKEGDPIYYNLHGPNQWPRQDLLPGFQEVYDEVT